jgi:hypothetical protein
MRLSTLAVATAIFATTMLTTATTHAAGRKSCAELKQEIAAKIDARGVQHYTLEIVEPTATGDRRVVGSCDGGTHRIVYVRAQIVPAQSPQAIARNNSGHR